MCYYLRGTAFLVHILGVDVFAVSPLVGPERQHLAILSHQKDTANADSNRVAGSYTVPLDLDLSISPGWSPCVLAPFLLAIVIVGRGGNTVLWGVGGKQARVNYQVFHGKKKEACSLTFVQHIITD